MLRGERGNSYVIVLVLTAMVAALSAATMQYMATTQSDVQATAAKFAQLALVADLAASLQTKEICGRLMTTTFNPAGVSNVSVRWADGATPGTEVRIQAGTMLADYGLQVESLTLAAPVLIGNMSATQSLYRTNLTLDVKSMGGERDYQPLKVTDLYVETSNGAFSSCYGSSDVVDLSRNTCLAIGGEVATDGSCKLRPNIAPVTCPGGHYIGSINGSPNCVAF